MNLKREYETTKEKSISSFEYSEIIDNYTNCISILDKEELCIIKGNY